MKYLIVGGTGFLGKNLLDRVSSQISQEYIFAPTREEMDINSEKSVESYIQKTKPDVIYNCSGITDANNSEIFEVNFRGSKHILESCNKQRSVQKIIFVGSAAEYGIVTQDDLPISEQQILNPVDAYGYSKVLQTFLSQEYQQKFGMNILIARVFNPLGRDQKKRFFLSHLIQQIQEGVLSQEPFSVELNNFDSERDFIDVRDVADILFQMAHKENSYSIYNVCSNTKTRLYDFAQKILDMLGVSSKICTLKNLKKPESLRAVQGDNTRLKQDFDCRFHSLDETMSYILEDIAFPDISTLSS